LWTKDKDEDNSETSKRMRILHIQKIVGIVFTATIFTTFYFKEHGDFNVIIFGTALYLPYVAILCLYNGTIIGLLEKINQRATLINYFLPVAPLLIWFIASDNVVRVRYWTLESTEFFIGLVLLLLSNGTGYLTCKEGTDTASR
jgi:hypothetical protein